MKTSLILSLMFLSLNIQAADAQPKTATSKSEDVSINRGIFEHCENDDERIEFIEKEMGIANLSAPILSNYLRTFESQKKMAEAFKVIWSKIDKALKMNLSFNNAQFMIRFTDEATRSEIIDLICQK